MNPLAWLLGLVLPACGFPAAEGLPTPQLMDATHIVRPSSPNTALAAPQGFKPPPNIVTRIYKMSADQLFDLVEQVAGEQPRTYQAAIYPGALQVHYVVRSAMCNFPDLVMAQVQKEGPNLSGLIIYSRSVYGASDLGANARRLATWLAALQAKIPSSSEK